MVYHEVLRQEGPIILLFNQWDEWRQIPEVKLKLPELARSSSIPFLDYDGNWYYVHDEEDTSRGQLEEFEGMRNMMGLTATCRALRQETRDLFFAINSFRIEVTILAGEIPRFSKDTASAPVQSFLKHLSTRSAISAVHSITLDLGYVWSWPEDSTPLHDMIIGLKDGFLKALPGLPLKVKFICGSYVISSKEKVHAYIDMQNLAASIELTLKRLRRWHQEELDYRNLQQDLEMCQEEFEIVTSQLEACLEQNAATEKV
ncbi:hypothetical protein KC363_g899 [Hortaea werneckii]|nr:hypothetical protein KC361_g2588 [Hortaea werneckii]KAI7196367.1 hypothetical protein KC363_g899 [Hortaea werneckii]KAI7512859.1 hypothetical protein KC347_g2130 [Hortaea werneckii]